MGLSFAIVEGGAWAEGVLELDVGGEPGAGIVESAEEEDGGGAGGEGGVDALGDEAVAEFEDGAGAGLAAGVLEGAAVDGGFGEFVFADEELGGFGAHEDGAAGFEEEQELVVAAALGGEIGDEAGLADAGRGDDGEAVLVDAEGLALREVGD
jgi:hypothetical protein